MTRKGARLQASADPIVIDGIVDLTGPTVATQAPIVAGYQTYFALVNRKGGVNGRQIQLQLSDDQFSVPKAVAAWQSALANPQIVGIIGMQTSSAQLALASQIASSGLAVVGPNTASSALFDPFNPGFFAVTPSVSRASVAEVSMAPFLSGINKPRIAFVAGNTAANQEAAGYVKRRALALGFEYVGDFFTPTAITNADTYMQQIIATNADVIICQAADNFAALLNQSAQTFNFKGTIIGGTGTASPLPWASVSQAVGKKFYAVSPFTPGTYTKNTPGAAALVAAAKANGTEKYLNNPLFTDGYVTAMVVAAGLKNAGSNVTRASFIKGLEKIKNLQTGLSPAIGYTANDHTGIVTVRPYSWSYKTSTLIPVGAFGQKYKN